MEPDGRATRPPLGNQRRLIDAHSRHIAPDHFDARENLFDLVSAPIEVTSIALVETSNTDAAPRGGDREKRALRRLRRGPRQVPLLREQSKGTSTMSFAGLPNDDEREKAAETGGNWRTGASLAMHGGRPDGQRLLRRESRHRMWGFFSRSQNRRKNQRICILNSVS